jgi:uncharacterized protein YlxW (UPF0749 family)
MQTERVTFLTSRDHKAALDAYARDSGMSVGHVVREATSKFISQPPAANDEEAELAALVAQVNEALPKMNASIDDMVATMQQTHEEVDRMLRAMGARH